MSTDTTITRYANWVANHPWICMFLSIAIVLAAASGGRFLAFKTDYRVFFSDDNPQLLAFDALEKMYTKNDNVMFIVTPKDGHVFTRETLEVVKKLTAEAWQVPYSIRVDSISNFQNTVAVGDDLVVEDLVPDDSNYSSSEIANIKSIALKEPFLVDRLVSSSGHVTGVNVTVQLPGLKMTETPEIVAFVRAMSDKVMAENPNIEIRLSGMVLMNNAFAEASQNDMKSVVLLSFVLMLVTLMFLLKSVSGTIATFLVIIFSIMAAMGLGGYIGFPLTPPSATTPNIVLTVAIANSVHILVSLFQHMRKGMAKREALIESLRINAQPVFIASITTAIGFLTMNFSDVPPFHHLGTMVAIGVMVSFFLSMVFLPGFIMVAPFRVKVQAEKSTSNGMARLGDYVVAKRRPLMWGMLALVIGLISFLPKNELNDVFVHYFDESVEFRQDADYFTENLSGLYNIEYSLDSGEPGGISNPEFLADVEKLANWYWQQPETMHVNTISDTMKRLNKNLHGDDERWYRQPNTRELAAQYLLLYEMSLPYGLDLNNQINVDKSATRFTVSLQTMSSNALLELNERAQQWIKQNTTSFAHAAGSGTSVMFAYIGKRNIKSMLGGTALALILISIILIMALKSFKIGMISLIPNLVPAAMGFGLWAILVGEVGLSLAVVASMTLGIVVDDTVHFLSKYLRARREKGLSSEEAVRYAFTTVGTALLTTSIVLVVGFMVLATSTFQLNAGMGQLTAIVIALALIADFFLLPPLLMKLDGEKNEQDDEDQQGDNDEKDEDTSLVLNPSTN
ncbi:MAG: RND family transporter [Thiohalomonadales bacterium]